jgi:hypothetical protein
VRDPLDGTEPLDAPAASAGDTEEVDALPVLAERANVDGVGGSRNGLVPRQGGTLRPAAQAVAVAAGGFVAGAAVVGLVHRRRRRATPLRGGRSPRNLRGGARRDGGRVAELVQIVGSRSLLVDVHLLGSAVDR